jgi:HAD superfamily hydrolase (TIGR01509 family)
VHHKAFNRVLSKYDYQLNLASYKKHFSGKSIKGGVLSLLSENKIVDNADDDFITEFSKQKINETIHIFKANLAFYADTLDFIKKVSNGNVDIEGIGAVSNQPTLAMVTGLEKTLLDEVLKHHNLDELFTVFITPDRYTHSKPNPECYLKALSEMGLTYAECIGIEDAPSGIDALNSAGIYSIGLTTTHDQKELQGAKMLTSSLASLIE